MIFLTGSVNDALRRLKASEGDFLQVGLLLTPGTADYLKDAHLFQPWLALDTGTFSEAGRRHFRLESYLELVAEVGIRWPDSLLWAVAPDKWADWSETLRLSVPAMPRIRELCPVALCLQDGATVASVPWDLVDCVFVGGTDPWRESPALFRLVREAKTRRKWVHFGRVNSLKRLRYAKRLGCNSADGTYLKHRPGVGTADVADWLDALNGPAWRRYDRSEFDLDDYTLGVVTYERED